LPVRPDGTIIGFGPARAGRLALNWSIYCDFDGTIALDDVSDLLLTRFAGPGWTALEDDWLAGRIGSQACMQGQFALLDADPAELDAVIDGVAIDPAFPRFVASARAAGCRVEVLSDGADRAIRRILARHGLADLPIAANHLVPVGGRTWRLESPHAVPACRVAAGTCKCACVDTGDVADGAGRRRLLVGDGASDFCVAGKVDWVLAKSRLIDHCRSHRLPHEPIQGFDDALVALERLLAQPGLPRSAGAVAVPEVPLTAPIS
jgi:2,3-diketo-5-methylthio-1-phosphopentane phosphatase